MYQRRWESARMCTRFFYSLLYELVEILDTDKLDFPPRMIRSILHAGMRRTIRCRIASMEWGKLFCDASDFETARHLKPPLQ